MSTLIVAGLFGATVAVATYVAIVITDAACRDTNQRMAMLEAARRQQTRERAAYRAVYGSHAEHAAARARREQCDVDIAAERGPLDDLH